MARLNGITETYWASMKEDDKLKWKFFSKGLVFFGTLYLTKTGFLPFDYAVAAATTIFSMLIIESQRTYKRFSPKLRKRIVRTCIFLGTWGTTTIGVLYFSLVAASAASGALESYNLVLSTNPRDLFKLAILIPIFLVVIFYTPIKIFRELHIEQIIYRLPHTKLSDLLVKKKFKADSLLSFLNFEYAIIASCTLYSIILTELVRAYLSPFIKL
ncbi:hypothetical protein B4O85_12150 [Pseudomonas azotoformans]|uniref:Uncharacterized protein n=1 Tax=Pseudomonas azotoformans TaxID=47878 RepID=A0A4Q0HU25_PSEAZ|nr:hypothetical protein B4O85_12150 [Pseudomonas azotoformans]